MDRPFFIAKHDSKPTGFIGAMVALANARANAAANQLAVDLLALEPDDTFLDLGCGAGIAMAQAGRRITNGRLIGVDHAPMALALTRSQCWLPFTNKRTQLQHANSQALPIATSSISKALAVHTAYFWSHPVEHFKEVRRVLRPSGIFVIGLYPRRPNRRGSRYPDTVYMFHTKAAIRADLEDARFDILSHRQWADPQGMEMLFVCACARARVRPGRSNAPSLALSP